MLLKGVFHACISYPSTQTTEVPLFLQSNISTLRSLCTEESFLMRSVDLVVSEGGLTELLSMAISIDYKRKQKISWYTSISSIEP